jgi:hypothetical protein
MDRIIKLCQAFGCRISETYPWSSKLRSIVDYTIEFDGNIYSIGLDKNGYVILESQHYIAIRYSIKTAKMIEFLRSIEHRSCPKRSLYRTFMQAYRKNQRTTECYIGHLPKEILHKIYKLCTKIEYIYL